MPSASDRIAPGPPRNAGAVRSFGLALLVHALLIGALTWGVNWKRSDQSPAFEAEIWSSVQQEAAPKVIEAPPPPPPPPPEPEVKLPEQKVTPPAPDVDIALEQEKKRKLLKQQQQKQEDAEEDKLLEKQKAAALAVRDKKLAVKKELAAKAELAAKEDLAKRKALEDAKKLEAKKQASKDLATAAALEQQRKQNLARAMGLAGATGGENAAGSALQASGPSASYGGKVRAKVKPNIVFMDDIQGNPAAEVEVRSSPTGTIMSQRLVKSSGNKAWDDAVIKAIIRTEAMPRDVDGRVPTPMILSFTPKDLAP